MPDDDGLQRRDGRAMPVALDRAISRTNGHENGNVSCRRNLGRAGVLGTPPAPLGSLARGCFWLRGWIPDATESRRRNHHDAHVELRGGRFADARKSRMGRLRLPRGRCGEATMESFRACLDDEREGGNWSKRDHLDQQWCRSEERSRQSGVAREVWRAGRDGHDTSHRHRVRHRHAVGRSATRMTRHRRGAAHSSAPSTRARACSSRSRRIGVDPFSASPPVTRRRALSPRRRRADNEKS